MIDGNLDIHIASKFCITWVKLINHKVGDHIKVTMYRSMEPINTLGRFDVFEMIDVQGPYLRVEWNLDKLRK